MKFEIGPGLSCDLDVLTDTRLLVQANSGGGKSWCIRRILEQTHGQTQHLVLDPEGEFSSLRERFDYVLAAKQGGDTIADPRYAKMLAERLLELRASVIIDIYELKAHERILFVRRFLDALVDAPKRLWHPALVVVDEAHVYCPEKGQAESAGAVIDLATRGRKRGFCAVLATQRLSKLHKDAAAECNNKLIGRTGLDVDMKRAGDELGFTSRDQQHQLRTLAPGEFYAFGPALSDSVQRVTVGPVQTHHPKAGGRQAFEPPPPTEKVRALLPQLSDLPQEAEEEARTVADLKRDLANTRRDLTLARKDQAPPDEALIQRRITAAVDHKEREVRAQHVSTEQRLTAMERVIGKTATELLGIAERLKGAINGKAIANTGSSSGNSDVRHSISRGADSRHQERQDNGPAPATRKPSIRTSGSGGEAATENGLDGPERRILNAVAWFDALGIEEPEQPAVAFLAGYTYGGGGYNNPRGRLKTKGLVEYVAGNRLRLTNEGRAYAEAPDMPATNEALHEAALDVLEGPHQRILRPLLDAWPDAMSNEENADIAGYTPGTGGHNNPRGRLKKMGLITYPAPGMLRAADLLFPDRGN